MKIFFLLVASITLFNCRSYFSTNSDSEKLSDEDIIWLKDSDGNGVADSIELYAPDCSKDEDCLEKAKSNKIHFTPVGGTYNDGIQVKVTTAGAGTVRYTTNGEDPSEKSKVFNDPIEITATTELKARKFLEGNKVAGPIQSALYEFKLNTPYATKKSGEYDGPIKIALGCENDKAEIFYSSDGSTPSDSSTPFKDSLKIFNSTTIKAIAIRKGWNPSDTMEVHYKIKNPEAVPPIFTPKGGTYTEPQKVGITSATEGAEIRYTLDGKDPDKSSKRYSGKISIGKGLTVKAIAMKKGFKTSPVSKAEFTIQNPATAAAPVFTPKGGTYTEPQKVGITSETKGVVIRYTLDGKDPDNSSQLYSDPISVDKGVTVKAVAMKEELKTSSVSKAEFIIKIPGTVAVPVFTPTGGAYTEPLTVGISSGTEGAEIRYTLDGKDPGKSSKLYSDKISVDKGTTIKAVAMKEGMKTSPISKADFTINIPGTAALPVFTPKGGTYTEPQKVGISSETAGAEIRYTLDGKDPGKSSKLYSDKISVDKETTIKAVAMKEGLKTSPVSVAKYIIKIPDTAAAPVFTPKGGTYTEPQKVGITSGTEGTEIRYTLDGKDPDESSNLYSEKISVVKGMTIKAIAMKEGMKTSTVSKADFTINLDSVAPSITLLNPSWKDTTVTVADVTIEIKAQDASGVKSVTINEKPASVSEDKYSQVFTLSHGENKIAIRAEDKSYNQNQSADTLKITYDSPPVAVNLSSPTHITGEGMRISWSRNDDVDFQAYKIYYSTSPSVSTSGNLAGEEKIRDNTTYEFSGLTSNQTYYVKVYVFDNTSSTGSNEISAFLNTAPVFTELAGQSVDENNLLSFQISATDADGDDLAYTMLSPHIPDAVFNASTRTFSWTPTYDEAGNYIAKFEVTDDATLPKKDTLSVNITVNNVNADSLVVRNLLDLNGLSSVPVDGDICKYTGERITHLYLDSGRIHGKLTTLPENIENLTELRTLHLDSNELPSLPSSIGNLSKLEVLRLRKNALTSLPDAIGNLDSLIELDISDNQLSSLPSSIGNLTKLELLVARRNTLTSLPDQMGNLVNLTRLYICCNQLSTLPSWIQNLTKLKVFSFWGNNLTNLPNELQYLVNLVYLDMSDHQLTNLPSFIGKLTKLQELRSWSNSFTSLPVEIGNLVDLTYLNFTRNDLDSLPSSIGSLTKLKELYFVGNNLTSLTEDIGDLTNLTTLWLQDNQLSSLPPEMVNLTNLNDLNINGNALCNLSGTVKSWVDNYSTDTNWESTQTCPSP